jgi:pantoate-beta-alanine ligase
MAFFGQKDAQQLALVRTMVADLDMPVEIRAVPIERDVDGLALSSRNSYLSATQRIEALALSQALVLGKDAAAHGLPAAGVREVALRYLAEAPGVRLDYLALVDPQTFQEIGPDEGAAPAVRSALLAVAAWVGPTRLIDNMEIELHG